MDTIGNVQAALSAKDVFEQSTRNLQGLFRLPKYLQEMEENSTHQQALHHAAEQALAFRTAEHQDEIRRLLLQDLGRRGIPQETLPETAPEALTHSGGRPKIDNTFYLDFFAEITTRIKNYRIDHPGQNPLLKELWTDLPTDFAGRTHRAYTRWLKKALKLQGSSAPNIQAWMKALLR